MTALARRELGPEPSPALADPTALPALRSDGLLKTDNLPAAWRTGDEFASDLVRDFAIARLLITSGWEVLVAADAPRWSIRAVRLACQVFLRRDPDVGATWESLEADFGSLAARFGQRWAELPVEAALALGEGGAVIDAIWPRLASGDGTGAQMLVRLALQRFSRSGTGDPAVLSPVVKVAFVDAGAVVAGRHWRSNSNEQVGELVLAWLRGLLQAGTGPLGLRQHARDTLLASNPEPYDEFAVEALASLGPDLDEPTAEFLRQLADHAGDLWPAVETLGAIIGMADHRPDLLLELAAAYYIDQNDRGDWGGFDEGIRHHRGHPITPQAAWYYGPFFRLLNRRTIPTLQLINRMLDHAAITRVRDRSAFGDSVPQGAEPPLGVDLHLPGSEPRRYVGDAHVWSWYRGSSVGPYPCMSALLAVERFADHLIDKLDIPIPHVIELLLRDCHNLAMPGLAVGLLVRHAEHAGDLLDPVLVAPEIWHLEFSRTVSEGLLHVQGRDDDDLIGRDRRAWNLRDVVVRMTLAARVAHDAQRLARLEELADELVNNARAALAGQDDAEEALVSIEGWAAAFRLENYRTEPTEDGLVVQYEHPDSIAAALAPSLADLAASHEAMRLQNTYGRLEDRRAQHDALLEDIVGAQQLTVPATSGEVSFAQDGIAAVAASAIVAHAWADLRVPADDLRWAADIVLTAAFNPQTDSVSYQGSIYPWGADRSAAAALPLLLLPTFDELALDRERLDQALLQCSTSLFEETRTVFATACNPVWQAPCDPGSEDSCRHRTLWDATQAGLRDARLGKWDMQSQRRVLDPISPPFGPELAATATDSLLINKLVPPLAGAASARAAPCVAADAEILLQVLLDAHRRGANHWARENYGGYEDRQRQMLARVLVRLTVEGSPEALTEHIRTFADNAHALEQLLRDFASLFTYDADMRPYLSEVWGHTMTAVLDAVDGGVDFRSGQHWADWVIGALLFTPHLNAGDSDPDATLARARLTWTPPANLSELIARWLPLARGEPKAADALAQLAKCNPMLDQLPTLLRWVEEVVDGRYERFANHCWYLPDWLGFVRETGIATGNELARWRRLVDGLAAAEDRRASDLQQLEE